ncbi:SGNH/GDSL hydrolase family protein [Paenibacillus sp. S150]|uniref:SGNH/GDSL hydrolase family protein n=1 Tax=Paenibacillus sp. S150 TaxID=2749826 RepID=UPI001C56ED2D|nr:SGNH/GDSL hydrolase family protein [Paenibacillus sp. S150]MBW4079930.1 SGNH/GDSL hydrolase family protein [Paenibacillus sp. S150]
MALIGKNGIVLFQGDSITENWRRQEDGSDLGIGYAQVIAAQYGFKHPDNNVTFLNRGVGGDRVPDLTRRWQKDCLDLKPTLVSIFVGINDTWRRYDENNPLSTEEFYTLYRNLLTVTKDRLDANMVLVEPFLLPVREEQRAWREDLDPKIQAVRQLAGEFGLPYVPLDGLFTAAASGTGPEYWSLDGVHPTAAGNGLIAEAWLKAVGA